MGFYDRDYYRQPGNTSYGAMRMWSVTTWLIAINIAVFILDQLSGRTVFTLGAFSAESAIVHLEIWRFLTFQFIHLNLTHIFFNMLALFYFGPMVEAWLGGRRYLAFYLLCGLAGVVLYLILMVLGVLGAGPASSLCGASAGIFGVLIAGAKIAPDATVMLLFPPIPMKLRTMAWVMVAIAVYTVFASGPNAGGQAGHLGGAALGYLLIRRPNLLNIFATWPPRFVHRSGWHMKHWR